MMVSCSHLYYLSLHLNQEHGNFQDPVVSLLSQFQLNLGLKEQNKLNKNMYLSADITKVIGLIGF